MIRMTLDGITKKIHAVQYILAVLHEKNIVLLRTVLSSNGRLSEWKCEDAITISVICARAA